MIITATIGLFCNILLMCVLGADHHAPSSTHKCHGHSHNHNHSHDNFVKNVIDDHSHLNNIKQEYISFDNT